MSESKQAPTPGPWTIECAPHRAWLAQVGRNPDDPSIWSEKQYAPGESYEFGDKLADARLMATAWDFNAAAIKVVASSHKLQDGKHDTPDGFVLVSEVAVIELNAALSKSRGEG